MVSHTTPFTHYFRQLTAITSRLFFPLLLIAVVSIGVAYSIHQKETLESRRVVDQMMLNLLSNWEGKKFFSYTTKMLRKNISTTDVKKMANILDQLGQMTYYHGAKGGLFRASSAWWQFFAHYRVRVSFQRGNFIVTLILVKQEGEWKIARFFYEYDFIPRQLRNSLKLV